MSEHELAKDLGLVSALAIGIGTMIGAGIFVLPGIAAQEAGPLVVGAFVLGGAIAMVNALSVSELGTAMPKAGGAYYYVNRSLGPLFGSISGLGDWLGLAFASAFYCIGFGQYLRELLMLPSILFLNEIQVGALLAGVVFIGVNYLGAKEAGSVQTLIVTILLAILGVLAVVGWFSFDWATLVSEGGLAPLGAGQLLPVTGLVFVSFLGYAKIATVAEEIENPGRNLPIAIVGSVAVVTVIYAILVTIMLGIVPWPNLDLEAPVAQVAELSFPGMLAVAAATLMTLGALLATASSANASILSSARINFAMGRDKIVTDWLNQIHDRFITPYRSILVTGAMILALVVFLGRDIAVLAEAASVLHLIVYALLNAALIVLRETNHPEYDPSFKVPLYPVVPILGIVLSLGLIFFMNPRAQIVAVLFVAGAIAWYLVYARRHTTIQGALGEYIRERPDKMPALAVSAAEAASPDATRPYRLIVPVANPETQGDLLRFAAAIAHERGGENAEIVAVNVLEVPPQTGLEQELELEHERLSQQRSILEAARGPAVSFGVNLRSRAILARDVGRTLVNLAKEERAAGVVMGWSGKPTRRRFMLGSNLDTGVRDAPCEVVLVKSPKAPVEDVTVLLGEGPHTFAAVRRGLDLSSAEAGEIPMTLVNVQPPSPAGDEASRANGEALIRRTAAEVGMDEEAYEVRVLISDDVDEALGGAIEAADTVVMGSTRAGLLERTLGRSVPGHVALKAPGTVVVVRTPDVELRSWRDVIKHRLHAWFRG